MNQLIGKSLISDLNVVFFKFNEFQNDLLSGESPALTHVALLDRSEVKTLELQYVCCISIGSRKL